MACLYLDGQIGASERNYCATRRQLGRLEFGRTCGKHEKNVERNSLQNEWDCNYRDETSRQQHQDYRKEKLLTQKRRIIFIYCESGDHSTNKCTRVLDVASRRDILRKKDVCFNCASAGNQVSHFKSRPCFKCGQKHHTTI